jgi:hypothetical protein
MLEKYQAKRGSGGNYSDMSEKWAGVACADRGEDTGSDRPSMTASNTRSGH